MKLPKRGRNEPPGTNLRSGGFIFLVSRIEKTAGSFGVRESSLFEPVDDLTPTSQLLHDVGNEPVGCGSEMDIDVWATLLLCIFRHPMSPNTLEFVYIWIS